jgi:hypothetical protein
LEWARWGGQLGERELTVEPGFRKKEAHGQDRTYSIQFKRQVAEEFLAGVLKEDDLADFLGGLWRLRSSRRHVPKGWSRSRTCY